jgi:hypothetical protein
MLGGGGGMYHFVPLGCPLSVPRYTGVCFGCQCVVPLERFAVAKALIIPQGVLRYCHTCDIATSNSGI